MTKSLGMGPQHETSIADRDSNLIPNGEESGTVTRLAEHIGAILDLLHLDRSDPNLAGTPERVAKMYLEMFHGLVEGAEPKVTTFPNEENYQAMVMERDVPFYSMCAHHLVPFYGHAHIAYIPNRRIVGLSKLPRYPGVLREAPADPGAAHRAGGRLPLERPAPSRRHGCHRGPSPLRRDAGREEARRAHDHLRDPRLLRGPQGPLRVSRLLGKDEGVVDLGVLPYDR